MGTRAGDWALYQLLNCAVMVSAALGFYGVDGVKFVLATALSEGN